ncbi:DNA-3-methyladenine glycosylase [Arenimonas sp.]|uniref:DNA-3-methyladenine glycosylase family protein n=1 Tax=Arenimonas sp. TaxID=1872635 RepID=UPI0035B3B297
MPRFARGFDLDTAAAHLRKRDRKLARWIDRIGPLELGERWRKRFDPTDALARAILYQQLSGKAAATIVGRVEAAIGAGKLHADTLARIDDAGLRACGVSGNKTLALRDLAARAAAGEVPSTAQMARLHDHEIIERLTAVRGIGRWTVEMMLMFQLGRPDVLPVDDLGVRKGAQLLDKLDQMPRPRDLAERGEAWGPYRTLAGLYLWRIADFTAPQKTPVKRSQD